MKTFFTCILLSLSSLMFSQESLWLKKSESQDVFTTHQFFSSVYFNDAFYTAGEFWKDISFDNFDLEITPDTDTQDAFILKSDETGAALDVFHFVSEGYVRIEEIKASTVNQSLIVIGQFRGPLSYGDQEWESLGYIEGFIAEITEEGELMWLKRVEAQNEFGYSVGTCFDIDSQGNIYAGFVTGGPVAIDGFEHENEGETIATLIVKLDAQGNALNTQYWVGSNFESFTEIGSIAVMDDNRIAFGGVFSNPFTYAGEEMGISGAGAQSYIIVEDADLSPIWGKPFIGFSSETSKLMADDGNLLAIITYNTSLTVNEEQISGTGSWRETALVKFDKDGNTIFIKNFTLSQYSGFKSVSANNICIYQDKYLLGGLYQNYVMHEGELILENQNPEGSDFQFPFIMELSQDGELLETHNFNGTEGPASLGFLTTSDDHIFYGGEFTSIIRIGNLEQQSVNSTLFYGMMGEETSSTGTAYGQENCEEEVYYSIEDHQLYFPQGTFKRVEIYDLRGSVVYAEKLSPNLTNYNLDKLPKGVYIANLKCETGRSSLKIINR